MITVVLLLVFVAGAAAWRLADVKPDPNVQAIADGCQRDTTKIYTGLAPNWVYVNDKDFPSSGPPPAPRWVSGTVKGPLGLLASRIASSDDPITHHSYDVNIDVTVDNANDFLTGVSRDTTPEQGTLHLERESTSFPEWARPQAGDRIQALGSWIWDCDHYQGRGEKTEFHPFRAAIVTRDVSPRWAARTTEADVFVSTEATPAGRQAECAHTTKGSDQFKSCSHSTPDWLSVNGSYAYDLAAPVTPCVHPGISSKDHGSVNEPRIVATVTSTGWHITFTINQPVGTRVVLAREEHATCENAPKLDHLRLHFDQLLVRRAMDPSCPPDKPTCPYANESTLLGQIVTAPGEWQLHWSVDGIWGRWPGTLAAKDGSTFRGTQSVDFYVQPGKPWTLVTLARECDFGALPGWDGPGKPTLPCPRSSEVGNSAGDDYPGAITVTQKGLALGTHIANASTAGSTCPPSNVKGCYQLTYTVSRLR
ncbi:MAG: hypothetical protein JWO17_1509 [Actinomycetia bacterium]|nr:hypothetical protein [Actinomycetes bacterium]